MRTCYVNKLVYGEEGGREHVYSEEKDGPACGARIDKNAMEILSPGFDVTCERCKRKFGIKD